MSTPVVAAGPQITIQHVARMMINHRVSGIPIVEEDGQLIGIITEGDLLRRLETGTERQRSRWSEWFLPNSRLAADYVKSHARRVADIMTRDVVTVDEFAALGEVADLMEQHRIKRVPVVHDGRLEGIVSRADLLRMLASGTVSISAEDTDRSIRNRLLSELRQQRWAALLNEAESSSRTAWSIFGALSARESSKRCELSPKTLPVFETWRITRYRDRCARDRCFQ